MHVMSSCVRSLLKKEIGQVISQHVVNTSVGRFNLSSPSFLFSCLPVEWKSKWAQVVITVMNDFAALPFRPCNMFSDPIRHPAPPFPGPPLLPPLPSLFRWMWVGCSGLFVFGKEIPCLCGGGCPWVFFFNHIFFDLLLLLLPRVCWSVLKCVVYVVLCVCRASA